MLKDAHRAYELVRLEGTPPHDVLGQDVVDWADGTWNESGQFFCTKNFFYEFAYPDIMAHRSNNIKEDCSGCSDRLYEINYGFPDDGGEIYCTAYTDVGYGVCQGLVSQGFELRDGRE